jgi:hypothetical protein
MVHTKVTRRAECNHPPRVIRPGIRASANVVGLKIWTAVGTHEGRPLAAALALPLCPKST